MVELFNGDVKTYTGKIIRFPSNKKEQNRFDSYGYITNRIGELQSIDDKSLEHFVSRCFDILTYQDMINEITDLLREQAMLSQTFYFEGSAYGTHLHQDKPYIPSTIDRAITIWIALEDIREDAGRFCLYAGSHQTKLIDISEYLTLPPHRREIKYLSDIRSTIKSSSLELIVPVMETGDTIIFDGNLIHGSLAPVNPQLSRHSITGLFIPDRYSNSYPNKIINGVNVSIEPSKYQELIFTNRQIKNCKI